MAEHRRPMDRRIVLLIASALVASSLVFALVAQRPDPYCFGYELGLGLLGGVGAPFVAAFVCGVALALLKARLVAYVLLVASLSIVVGMGFVVGLWLGYDHCAPSSPLERGVPWAIIGLMASLVGVVPGFAVGRLIDLSRRRG